VTSRVSRKILPSEAEIVQRIFLEYVDGYKTYTIATRLNAEGIPSKTGGKWHPRTIGRMLSNRAYIGETVYGKERSRKVKDQPKRVRQLTDPSEWINVEGYTPAIVSTDLFKKVQKKLSEPIPRGRSTRTYVLTGHIKCGYCGTGAVGSHYRKRTGSPGVYSYYICRGTIPTSVRPRVCMEGRRVRSDLLEPSVFGHLKHFLSDPVTALQLMATANGSDETSRLDREITRLRKVISNNSNQIERNLQLYTFGEVDEAWIKEHNRPLRQRSEDAQKELETVLSQRESTGNIEEMREDLQEVCTLISEKLDSADDQQKKLILDALQVEVTVTGQKVNLGLELGVAPEVSRLTTTGRTSACMFTRDQNVPAAPFRISILLKANSHREIN